MTVASAVTTIFRNGCIFMGIFLKTFRWNTIVLDGHDVDALCRAFFEAENTKGRPTCILAKTFKGKGFPGKLEAVYIN